MHLATFLQDLAVIMIVAGLVTIIFHRLRQPVVLGYMLAGLILGPHTPPTSFIHDETVVNTLAELGVIFLMFSLGLEFSIRKLLRVGITAFIAALSEIIFMILVGYEVGQVFGWKPIDSFFLGAMLAISSTTIIVKALSELKIKRENFAQLIFGILIIEDILAIAILALLSSVASGGSLNIGELMITLEKLLVFLVVSFVIGMVVVLKLINYVARFNNKEMMLVTVLGICFGFSLLVIKLGYSVALGAFIVGAIMAEAEELKVIERLITPLTSMFSPIFFVSIGMLVDLSVMKTYYVEILVITFVLIIGKVLICSSTIFLAGRDGKTAMRVGMGLSQIGEFSFIIASLGISLKVMSPYLYPIIVAISAITTFLTPYLIKASDPLTAFLARIIPPGVVQTFNTYTTWLQNISTDHEQPLIKQAIKIGLLQIFINLILIIAIFIAGFYCAHKKILSGIMLEVSLEKAVIWGASLILSIPFLIAIYRKSKGLSMLLAEMTVKANEAGEYNIKLRRIISEVIPVASILGILLIITALSASILPPIGLFIFVLVIAVLLTAILFPWFIKLHSRLQIAFIKTFKKKKN